MSCSLRESVNSFVFQKILRYQIDEGIDEVHREFVEYKYLAGVLGVALGAGLLWRWYRRKRIRNVMNKSREKKQKDRRRTFELLDQQLQNKMTGAEVDAITKLPIKELLERLKTGDLTAVQVLTAYQIKSLEVHQKTNCIIEPVLEAIEWAQELDRADHKGPLHGLPVSLKECIGIKGYDVTAGCARWIDDPCLEDAVLVQVLKNLGAVPFVRTNLPQTMISFESTNPIFGRTVNPHDPKRLAGGSSGGEGAIVAGGGSILGVGSDVAGSIRNPGAMCGVPAFKPTALRVSKKGGRPVMAGKNILSSWGPLAREVDSLVLFMRSILVPEMYRLDPVLPVMPFRDEVLLEKRSLRIGYSFFNGVFEVVPAMRRAVAEAKELLEASGHQLVPWDEDMTRLVELWIPCLFADGGQEIYEILEFDVVDDSMELVKLAASIPPFLRRILALIVKPFRPEMSRNLKDICGFRTVSAYWNAIKEIKNIQDGIIGRWQKNNLDAVVCPAFGCPAVSNGLQQHLSGVMTYTAVFNMLDFPSGCVPVTYVSQSDESEMERYPETAELTETYQILKKDLRGSVGLPVSVQVAALPWRDELCLRVMSDLEKAVNQRSK